MISSPPPPGSDEALELGCRCPVMDNGHGSGYLGGCRDPETGNMLFVISVDCPLHAPVSEPDAAE